MKLSQDNARALSKIYMHYSCLRKPVWLHISQSVSQLISIINKWFTGS